MIWTFLYFTGSLFQGLSYESRKLNGALIEVGAGFHPNLNGKENIYVNGAILGMSKEEIDEKYDEIVEFADIGDFINSPVKYYSSGMYVRLGFAVAVHCDQDVLLIDEEEIRCRDGKGSWRRRGVSIKDRRLLKINASTLFNTEHDFLQFLPPDLSEPFTNRRFANQGGIPIRLAQKITYCLEKMQAIQCIGRARRARLFETIQPS